MRQVAPGAQDTVRSFCGRITTPRMWIRGRLRGGDHTRGEPAGRGQHRRRRESGRTVGGPLLLAGGPDRRPRHQLPSVKGASVQYATRAPIIVGRPFRTAQQHVVAAGEAPPCASWPRPGPWRSFHRAGPRRGITRSAGGGGPCAGRRRKPRELERAEAGATRGGRGPRGRRPAALLGGLPPAHRRERWAARWGSVAGS